MGLSRPNLQLALKLPHKATIVPLISRSSFQDWHPWRNLNLVRAWKEKHVDILYAYIGGLAADYNSIVASLTDWDDDISLHFVNSILLTHE